MFLQCFTLRSEDWKTGCKWTDLILHLHSVTFEIFEYRFNQFPAGLPCPTRRYTTGRPGKRRRNSVEFLVGGLPLEPELGGKWWARNAQMFLTMNRWKQMQKLRILKINNVARRSGYIWIKPQRSLSPKRSKPRLCEDEASPSTVHDPSEYLMVPGGRLTGPGLSVPVLYWKEVLFWCSKDFDRLYQTLGSNLPRHSGAASNRVAWKENGGPWERLVASLYRMAHSSISPKPSKTGKFAFS